MEVTVIAIYRYWDETLAAMSGVRKRMRGQHAWAQVPCEVEDRSGTFVARPMWDPPPMAPAPQFRLRLEVPRHGPTAPEVMLVLHRKRDAEVDDPEQRVMAPILNNPRRLVYEFQRAEVVYATKKGAIEVREMVIDVADGRIGSRVKFNFHGSYAKLAARCSAHLGGTLDLYPPAVHKGEKGVAVPAGKPNLRFGHEPPGVARKTS